MSTKNIVVAFGCLDKEAFDKSYRVLFEELYKESECYSALLSQTSAKLNSIPTLTEMLELFGKDNELNIFPLMLNYGKETREIDRILENYQSKTVHKPLLESNRKIIVSYLKEKTKDTSKTYVVLGHGSLFSGNDCYFSLKEELGEHVYLHLHHQPVEIYERTITTVPLMLTHGKHVKAMNEELRKRHEVNAIQEGMLECESFRKALIASIKENLK